MSVTATINYKATKPKYRFTVDEDVAQSIRYRAIPEKCDFNKQLADAGVPYGSPGWPFTTRLAADGGVERIEGDKVPDTVTITMPYDVARGLKAYLFAAATWSRTQGGRAARDLHDALSDGGITADYSAPKAGA